MHIRGASPHLDDVWAHSISLAHLVHIPLQIHVQEFEHEVQLCVTVYDVKEAARRGGLRSEIVILCMLTPTSRSPNNILVFHFLEE